MELDDTFQYAYDNLAFMHNLLGISYSHIDLTDTFPESENGDIINDPEDDEHTNIDPFSLYLFPLDKPEYNDGEQWRNMYSNVCAYGMVHGHYHVPLKGTDPTDLYYWVRDHRLLYALKMLENAKIAELNQIGFFDTWLYEDKSYQGEISWDEHFVQLYQHSRIECDMFNVVRSDSRLCRFIFDQRLLYTNNQLCSEKIEAMNRLHFTWHVGLFGEFIEPFKKPSMMDAIVIQAKNILEPKSKSVYKHEKNSHHELCDTTHKHKRKTCVACITTNSCPKRIKRQKDSIWLLRLQNYYNKHGNIYIPYNDDDVRGMAFWISGQRRKKRLGDIAKDTELELDRMKIDWNPSRGRSKVVIRSHLK